MVRLRWMALLAGLAVTMGCGDDDDRPMADGGVSDTGTSDSGADAMTMGDGGDPCQGLTLCAAAGTRCDGDSLVTCAANAAGCLVETTSDCAAMGGACEVTDDVAACTVDPCADVENTCAAEARSCDEDVLVVCAMDAMGCLVETRTDCPAMTDDAVCDDTVDPVACVVPDPCEGRTDLCAAEGRACDGDELVVCAMDAVGCLVETRTDCTAAADVCDDSGAAAMCVEVSACPEADPMVLDCASGTVTGTTAMASTVRSAYPGCTTVTNYALGERIYRFRNASRVAVEVIATRGAGTAENPDYDLFVVDGGDESLSCGDAALMCLDASRGVGPVETVAWVADADHLYYVVYDLFGSTPSENEFTLEVSCTPIVCGDGIVVGDEECDDGNDIDGDGCSATCTREPGYDCSGSPSVCVIPPTDCATRRTITVPAVGGTTTVTGNTTSATNDFTSTCGGSAAGRDHVYEMVVTDTAVLRIQTVAPTSFDTVLHVRGGPACEEGAGTTLFCDDDGGAGSLSRIEAEFEPGTYFVVVDGFNMAAGAYTLEVEAVAPPDVVVSVSPAAAIPDNDTTGVSSAAVVAGCATVAGINLDIDITHTWRGDLVVRLTDPSGTTHTLWSRSGAGADDLVGNFNQTLAPSGTGAVAIASFVGASGDGTWTLTVVDAEADDEGTLNEWTLNLVCAD